MRTLYLDFETYYDKEFSLSKLTTQEYITDPRFRVLMLSVALDDGPVVVLDADSIPEFLALLDPKDICVVSHNSVFDQLILSHHYGFVPALAGDTMALARALGWHVAAGGGSLDALSRALGEHMPELALPHKGTAVTNALGKHRGDFTDDQWVAYKDYCKTDTILLRHLWQQMLRYARETAPQTYPAMPVTEIAFEDLIIKCATDPRLMINVDVIDQELEDLEVRRVKILTDVQEHLGTATLEDTLYVLRSNNRFAAVLELMGAQAKYKTGVPMGNGDETGLNPEIVIPQKVSKTTGKWTWAFGKTDAGMQELAQHEDEAIAAVVNARLGTKSSIAQTRAEKFKRLAEDGFLSIPYLICGAHTSRMSGRDINCFTEETEFLSATGWVSCRDWQPSMGIYQWNVGDRLSLTYDAEKVESVADTLVEINAPFVRGMFTENHRMIRYKQGASVVDKSVIVERTAAQVAGSSGMDNIPLSGVTDRKDSWLTPEQVRVMVAAAADSHTTKKGVMVFGFRKERKVQRLKQLLDAAKVSWREFVYKDTHYIRINKLDIPVWLTKGIGAWVLQLNAEALNALCDELVHWDGHPNSRTGAITFFTTKREEAEWVATAFHLCGRAAAVYEYDRKAVTSGRVYHVYERKRPTTSIDTKRQVSIVKKDDTPVFCATVPSGYILVRCRGRIFVTGNCQNLPSGRVQNQSNALRRSIVPRQENQKLVVCDASQIEVRVASYIAGNYRTLQAFVEGKDIYVATASGLYQEDYDHILRKAKVEEDPEYKMKRQVAKAAELSCQFGTGARAFRNYAKVVGGVSLTKEQAKETVATWREVNWPIVQMWDIINNVLYRMIEGESGYFGGPNNDLFYFDGSRHVLGKHIPGIRMPSGLWINYRGLTTEPGQWPDGSPKTDFVYYQNKGKRLEKTYTYAAKVFENCIAEGTEVLTDSGWKPIECITSNDKVFDGEEFVRHQGIISKDKQSCISVDGVFMTPDHKVLTKSGWVVANEITSQCERLDRGTLWHDGCTGSSWQCEGSTYMESVMRLREYQTDVYCEHKKSSATKLWVSKRTGYKRSQKETRAIQHPVLQCVACNEAALFEQKLSYISAIRGAWDNASRKLARFSEFLRRHVSNLSTRFMLRPDRQQQGIFKRQLSLGNVFTKREQHKKIYSYSSWRRLVDCCRIWKTIQPKIDNYPLSIENGGEDARTGGTSRLIKQVFDIRNCGPRSRFVVRGERGPVIVHNCTQGTAFQLMAWQAVNINRRYPISMNSHDEWAVVTDEPEAALQYMVECMTQAPPWLPGIPLAAEGSIADNYGDAK